jgi:cytochrome c oxidase cbb3-type subunit 3
MGTQTIPDDDPGKEIYGQLCFGCHGFDGSGNSNIGAPSLIDDVWLYGNNDAALTESIMIGRNGRMPAFQDRLDNLQIKLLVAWLTRQ